MKNKNRISQATRIGNPILLILIIAIGLIQGCTRESIPASDNEGGPKPRYVTPPPITVPSLDYLNDQKRYIALGLAELLNNGTMAVTVNSFDNIFNYLNLSLGNDIMPMHSLAFKRNNAYLMPTVGANNEFGDAINFAINFSNIEHTQIQALNSTPWEWDALEKCILSAKVWNAFVQIPDYQSLTPSQLSMPVCVVPIIKDIADEEMFPITAYIWDFTNSQVVQHQIKDLDEINDNPAFLIVCVDYAPGPIFPIDDPTGLCAGDWAPECGNEICEASCGETIDNCSDCAAEKNKVLRIKRYALTMDHRVRAFCSSNPRENHLKKIGNFSMGFGSFVEKPNNNILRRGGIFDNDKLKRSSAHLESQSMFFCKPTANNSGASWSEDYPKRTYFFLSQEQTGEAILDPNFNPKLSNAMIYWYHYDRNGSGQTVTVNKTGAYSVSYGYLSKHSLLGGWDPSTQQKFVSTSYNLFPFTTPAAQLQLVTTTMWQDWSLDPVVPSSDEITIITPNGDFMYVIEYTDQ